MLKIAGFQLPVVSEFLMTAHGATSRMRRQIKNPYKKRPKNYTRLLLARTSGFLEMLKNPTRTKGGSNNQPVKNSGVDVGPNPATKQRNSGRFDINNKKQNVLKGAGAKPQKKIVQAKQNEDRKAQQCRRKVRPLQKNVKDRASKACQGQQRNPRELQYRKVCKGHRLPKIHRPIQKPPRRIGLGTRQIEVCYQRKCNDWFVRLPTKQWQKIFRAGETKASYTLDRSNLKRRSNLKFRKDEKDILYLEYKSAESGRTDVSQKIGTDNQCLAANADINDTTGNVVIIPSSRGDGARYGTATTRNSVHNNINKRKFKVEKTVIHKGRIEMNNCSGAVVPRGDLIKDEVYFGSSDAENLKAETKKLTFKECTFSHMNRLHVNNNWTFKECIFNSIDTIWVGANVTFINCTFPEKFYEHLQNAGNCKFEGANFKVNGSFTATGNRDLEDASITVNQEPKQPSDGVYQFSTSSSNVVHNFGGNPFQGGTGQFLKNMNQLMKGFDNLNFDNFSGNHTNVYNFSSNNHKGDMVVVQQN